MVCPACSAEVPAGARFCQSCGTPLSTRADERRIVTVLFADLVGFTTLSEQLDPEHVKNLVDRCFERLVTDIHSFGGRVDKIVGDAIVALFGAPVAHEDDAERAVRAALRMQETMQAEAEVFGESPVELRVGVNTGEVLVGALRAGGDYTAMGDVVNVASRLQNAATPGQVLVGPLTHAATREVVRYDAIGRLDVRGRAEPVDVWHAVEAVVPPGSRPSRRRADLVGRDEEIGVLRHALATTARRRRAHVALLTGEPGIGKSRLAAELAASAKRDHAAAVLEGRCVPYGEANVWWPLATAIKQVCGIDAADDEAAATRRTREAAAKATGLEPDDPEVARLVEAMQWLLGLGGPLADIDPTRAREDALRAVHRLLSSIAVHRPVVLVVSELHWADKLLVDFLDGLLLRMRSEPFMLVATARPELADRWQPDPWRHNVVTLHLDPLDEEAASELLGMLTEDDLSPELRDTLLARSGGNPLFLEELAALVNESGGVADVPASLRSLVATRLDALPEQERRTLELASVVGAVGSVAAVAELAASTSESVSTRAALDELVARDLLTIDDGQWMFRSELVREVAYETLTKAERARRHAALAGWLAGQDDKKGELGEHLAHHLGTAAELSLELGAVIGLPDDIVSKALAAISTAAERAEHKEIHASAARLLDQALRLVPAADRETRRRLLVRRARARTAIRELHLARADVAAALKNAELAGDDSVKAMALTALGDIQQKENSLYDSAATLREAADIAARLDDARGLADALRLLGMTELFMGELDAAERDIFEALRIFRSLGERRGEAWATQSLAWIALTTRDHALAEERITEAMRIFEAIGDWGGWGWAVGLLSWLRYFEGRLDEAESLARVVVPELRERGDRWALGMQTTLLAGISLWRGEVEAAADAGSRARKLFAALDDHVGEARAMLTLTRALAALGRVDETTRLVEEVEAMAPGLAEPGMQAVGAMLAAGIAVCLGDAGRAVEAAARAQEGRRGIGAVEIDVLGGLAALLAGNADGAAAVLEQAYEAADAVGMRAYAGSALALARAAAGMTAEAEAVADEVDETGGGTYFDHQLLAWARGFARLGEADEEGARAALQRAVEAADATSDVIVQALSRLALAKLLETIGDPVADATDEEARDRLERLGLPNTAWDAVFTDAARQVAAVRNG